MAPVNKPQILAPFALIGAAALVVATWAGLARIGWNLGNPPAIHLHGPMMALGFLGTVIGMERAVGLGRRWAVAAPAFSAVGVVTLLLGLEESIGAGLITLSGLVLVAVFVVAYRIQPELHIVIMGLGAVAWVGGGFTWMSSASINRIVPWLAGFLILTIGGERLELTRMAGPRVKARSWLLAAAVLFLGGIAASAVSLDGGVRVAGLGMLGMAGWLSRFDIARRTIKTAGVTRYMAAAMLAGYAWLTIAGAIWLINGLGVGTLAYDAALHAVFLGFVFSMVFAHAPVIIPAVAGIDLPYHPVFWAPLIVLHGSLVVRILGDLAGVPGVRMWGGMLNAVAILGFLIVVIRSVRSVRRQRSAKKRQL